ncbi:MAG: dicarboxylate/amino acid:cation symporter, partial [Aminipila sp.]
MKSNFLKSLPMRLVIAVAIGIIIGLVVNAGILNEMINSGIMNVVVTLKFILGQFISFCVPLIIIGFIA